MDSDDQFGLIDRVFTAAMACAPNVADRHKFVGIAWIAIYDLVRDSEPGGLRTLFDLGSEYIRFPILRPRSAASPNLVVVQQLFSVARTLEARPPAERLSWLRTQVEELPSLESELSAQRTMVLLAAAIGYLPESNPHVGKLRGIHDGFLGSDRRRNEIDRRTVEAARSALQIALDPAPATEAPVTSLWDTLPDAFGNTSDAPSDGGPRA